MLGNLAMGILLQCVNIPNHHAVHLPYITTLFVNYSLIKLKDHLGPILKMNSCFAAFLHV